MEATTKPRKLKQNRMAALTICPSLKNQKQKTFSTFAGQIPNMRVNLSYKANWGTNNAQPNFQKQGAIQTK